MKLSMKRGGLWVAGVAALIGVGLLIGSQEYAQGAEDDSKATCSEATLRGTYLFAYQGVETKENDHVPFASAGYGEISRNEPFSGTYTVNEDCTGTSTYTDGTHFDEFIAPDGSMFTFVQTDPGLWRQRLNCRGRPSGWVTELPSLRIPGARC
jgi:hypothetical protein